MELIILKKNLLLAVLIAAALSIPTSVAVAIDTIPAVGETDTQRYIVAFHEDPGMRPGDSYQGASVVQFIDGLNFAVVETQRAETFEVRTKLDERVRYVEWDNPEWAFIEYAPNDPLYNDPGHYGTHVIDAHGAWDATMGSTSIKVGVVDTGINRNHEDFVGGRVLQGYDFYNNDNEPEDAGGQCNYHGSHTAGTIGATSDNGVGIAGLAQVQILPVKAFGGGRCGGSTTALVNGMKYVGDQGAHVSSNSWGSSASSSAFNDAVTYAHNKGSIHVAAAGNSGSCTNCVGFPWRDVGSISIVVTASNSADGWASFSSQGPQVDVIAPGASVLSVNGAGGYQTMSGTSMAAPHVSGVAALMKSLSPGMSFSQVEGQIKSTADDLGMISDRQGAGRLNACNAVGSSTCGSSSGGGGGGDGGGDTGDATMHVHDISHSRKGNPNTGDVSIAVTIADAAEAGVASANVCISVTKSGGPTASGCAPTGSNGSITFTWGGVGSGTYTTCVTDLTRSGYTWDQSADHASSGNCHTSSV